MQYNPSIKRILDLALALILCVALLPLFLIISVLVIVFMGQPILFVHHRPGLNQVPFRMFKFRSMVSDHGNGLTEEERITKFGIVMRRFSLDELPQLLNVLKGEMSLVGPRPLLMEYLDEFSDEQKKRFDVRPGITGLAQVSGRNSIGWEKKLELDIDYSQNLSFKQDVRILLRTISVVLISKGFAAAGEDEKFRKT
jgi:undecaprenyl phosphate N,N'-diacetylbacillosamine 1-phosphate transferase